MVQGEEGGVAVVGVSRHQVGLLFQSILLVFLFFLEEDLTDPYSSGTTEGDLATVAPKLHTASESSPQERYTRTGGDKWEPPSSGTRGVLYCRNKSPWRLTLTREGKKYLYP